MTVVQEGSQAGWLHSSQPMGWRQHTLCKSWVPGPPRRVLLEAVFHTHQLRTSLHPQASELATYGPSHPSAKSELLSLSTRLYLYHTDLVAP